MEALAEVRREAAGDSVAGRGIWNTGLVLQLVITPAAIMVTPSIMDIRRVERLYERNEKY